MPSTGGERSFLAKHRWAVTALVVLIAWLIGHHYWVRWISGTAVYETISLSPPGSFEKDIIVRKPEIYQPELVFSIGDVPREEMWRLLGEYGLDKTGNPRKPGVIVSLRWLVIPSGSNHVVASTEINSFGTSSHSSETFAREAGPALKLAPGIYRFRLEIVRDVPELRFLKTQFRLRRNAKGRASWHDDLIFWGAMLNFYLLIPLTALLALYLIARYVRSLVGPAEATAPSPAIRTSGSSPSRSSAAARTPPPSAP